MPGIISEKHKIVFNFFSSVVKEINVKILNCIKNNGQIKTIHSFILSRYWTLGIWTDVPSKFQERWNFPHCIGTLDSKHIAIRKPPNSGSKYFNYKKYFSIIFLADVDADYKFIFIDVVH